MDGSIRTCTGSIPVVYVRVLAPLQAKLGSAMVHICIKRSMRYLLWEFHYSRFCLCHNDWKAFAYTPCLPQSWKFQWIYLIYRWIITLFFQIWLFLAGFHRENGGPKFFIFLTSWSFLVFNAHLLWSAISVTLSYFLANLVCKKKYDNLTLNNLVDEEEEYGCKLFYKPVGCCGKTRDGTVWYQKLQWFLFNIGNSWAIAVSILYWALLRTGVIDGVNITTHLVNGIVALIDIVATRIPVRILHIVYPVVATGIYLVFTGIYFAAGGTNTRDNPYIYSLVDYGSNPGQSAGIALAVTFIFYPIMFLIVYGLFLLREGIIFLVKKACFKKSEAEEIEMDAAKNS